MQIGLKRQKNIGKEFMKAMYFIMLKNGLEGPEATQILGFGK